MAPDYHVTIDYVHYSVPRALIGRQMDVRLTASKVAIMSDGAVVAEHGRLHGRRGQCSTVVDHMPENHRLQESPWSRERFGSWARRIGPETEKAIARLLDSRPIAEQALVGCRNMLGLSKSYSPELLERVCTKANAVGAIPSYTACKNSSLSIKTAGAEKRSGKAGGLDQPEVPVDRAKSAGLTRGADAYRKVVKLVRETRFKFPSACVEDALYLKGRKLSKDRVQRWAECDWVENREVMVVISKTGCGKSYLCQALGNAACQNSSRRAM